VGVARGFARCTHAGAMSYRCGRCVRPGALLRRCSIAAALALLVSACGTAPEAAPRPQAFQPPVPPPPPLPDAAGWGVHVLAMTAAADRGTWVGSYDGALWRIPPRAREWLKVATSGLAPGPITSIALPERDTLAYWYGTAGGGFARTADGGGTWRAWPQHQAAGWNYVVPRGIILRRDTVYVATTDGLRYTADGGATWVCLQGPGGAPPPVPADGCTERRETLPTSHLLSFEIAPDGELAIGHLRGLSRSTDRGRTWAHATQPGLANVRVRSVRTGPDTLLWALTETALFADSPRVAGYREIALRVPGYRVLPGAPRAILARPGPLPVLVATSHGMLGETAAGDFRLFFLSAAERWRPAGDIWTGGWWGPPMIPIGGSAAGLNRIIAGELPFPLLLEVPRRVGPAAGRHLRFERPVQGDTVNPFADGTARFGAPPTGRTEGAPVPGTRYLNPPGTEVRAIGAGVIVRADAGRVVLRHDDSIDGRVIYSVYETGGPAAGAAGDRVQAGAVVARVGRALLPTAARVSVHALAAADTAGVAGAALPPGGALNPELWIRPLPGTGIVAGRVLDRAGQPVAGVRVRGLVLPYPTEAPFSHALTYAQELASPVYGENFAVGDVPAGDYTLAVELDGVRVWRRVRVAAGQVTFVEFRP
jgi:hypothetical protein